jgi:hypothetical protein
LAVKKPMRASFSCARAVSGHAAAAPLRRVMNSRRVDHFVGDSE